MERFQGQLSERPRIPMRHNRQRIALAAACSSGAIVSPASSPPAMHPGTSVAAANSTATASVQSAGKATSSCDVLNQAEAGAALGQPVQPPVKGHAFVEGGVACVFDGPNAVGDDPDIPYADTVRVVLVTGPKAKAYFEDYRSKVSAQQVSGLGDAAYYDGFASISVLKRDACVRIAVGIATTSARRRHLPWPRWPGCDHARSNPIPADRRHLLTGPLGPGTVIPEPGGRAAAAIATCGGPADVKSIFWAQRIECR
jgi:hypothetical protein